MNRRGVDVLLIWLACAGMWPFADPGHAYDTVLSSLDIVLHWLAIGVLATRWRVVRREVLR